VAEVVEHLPSKHEVLSSNHSTATKQKEKNVRNVHSTDTVSEESLLLEREEYRRNRQKFDA
jgi:hypothetical protein